MGTQTQVVAKLQKRMREHKAANERGKEERVNSLSGGYHINCPVDRNPQPL